MHDSTEVAVEVTAWHKGTETKQAVEIGKTSFGGWGSSSNQYIRMNYEY